GLAPGHEWLRVTRHEVVDGDGPGQPLSKMCAQLDGVLVPNDGHSPSSCLWEPPEAGRVRAEPLRAGTAPSRSRGTELRVGRGRRRRVYPILFRLGGFEVTSFGVMVALGALAGFWTFRRELRVRGIPEATDAAVFGLIGGLAGAKLLFVLEHLDTEPAWALLTSRGGLSWFGGLVGGVAAGLLTIRHRRWPMLPVLAAATPALALGQMFGRIGCFLVGDDYGLPTDLPWGVAFPEGLPPTAVPVHPTQLYEAVFLAALALFIVAWRQRGMPDRA